MPPQFFPVAVRLLHVLFKESLYLIKRYDIRSVIQIRMNGIRDDHKFLVIRILAVPYHCRISILAELAGMCLLPVDKQNRTANLIAVL